MTGVSMESLVLASLHPESGVDGGGDGGVALSALTAAVSAGGRRLSRNVEVATVVDDLVERGAVRRKSDAAGVRFWLTAEGREDADAVRSKLADSDVELVDGDDHCVLSLSEAAAERELSVVELAAACSDDGVYYVQDDPPADGIVGRTTECEQFGAVLDTVVTTGEGRVVSLSGLPGIGKTTLADALLEDLPDDVAVRRARCDGTDSEPYGPIRDALEPADGDDPFDVAGVDPEDAETYEAQQTALFHAVTEQLRPESGVRVLFLDDVEEADAATWSYLSYLLDRLSDLPIVVLCTHRPGTIDQDEHVACDDESHLHTRLELEGLDRGDTKRLIEQHLARRGAPDAFVDAVHERTDGTPLFVEATVEALVDSGQLDPQFQWYPDDADAIDLPDAVRETVVAQLDVAEDARDLLQWVGVAEEFVPVDVLAALSDEPADRVRTMVDTLLDLDMLVRTGDGGVRFQSNVVRETVLQELDPETKRHRHGAIARWLDGTGDLETTTDDPGDGGDVNVAGITDPGDGGDVDVAGITDPGDGGDVDVAGITDPGDGGDVEAAAVVDADRVSRAATIASHYEQAGDTDAAIEWYESAADRATAVYAHETATDHYHSVLDLARSTDARDALLSTSHRLADLSLTIGEYDEAERYVEYVRERLVDDADGGLHARNARLAAAIAEARGDYDAAVETAREALAGRAVPDRDRCRLLAVLADAEWSRGDYDAARETSRGLRDLAADLGADDLRAEAIQQLGVLAMEQSEYERAREALTTALEVSRDIGDQHREADVRTALGIVAKRRADFDRAREHWETALASYEDVGDRHQIAKVYNNLGLVAKAQGAYDDALARYREALAELRRIGDEDTAALVRMNLGNVAEVRSEYDDAREQLEAAVEGFQAVGRTHHAAVARLNLGNLLVTLGAYDRAEETLLDALDATKSLEDTFREGQVESELARLARRRGDGESAREYYDATLEASESVDNDGLRAKALADRAKYRYASGDYEGACEDGEAALATFRENDDRVDVADVERTLGLLAVAREQFEAASERLDAAGGGYRAVGDDHGVARVEYARGVLARARGDDERAREAFESALETFETVGARTDAVDALESLVELSRERDWTAAAREYCADGAALAKDVEPDAVADREWFLDRQPD